ncbi:MAG: HAMP domain-containing protein, partial [Caldilineaceae bacterium]|nr:HAMP domain-containing protein [Caldilineaceae bacterium]
MKWTIFNKMLVAFGIIALFLVAMAAENWIAMTNSINETEIARDRDYAGAELAQNVKLDVLQVWQWLTDISATRAAEGFDDGFAEAEANAVLFREHLATLKALQPDHAAELTALGESFEEFYTKGQWMAQQYIDGGPELGNLAMSEFDAYAADLNTKLDAFVAEMYDEAHMSIDDAIAHSNSTRRLGLILAVVAVLSAVGIAYFMSSSMSKDLRQMVKAAHGIAQGNIDQEIRIKRQDEIGELAGA